ncbi:MAG: glycosyl hydrolase family 8 [Pseudomonadota bacterium]
MIKSKRNFLRGSAVAIAAALGVAGTAAAAVPAPYGVAVSYNASANSANVSFGADAPAAYGYGIERRPVGRTTWTQVKYLAEPNRAYLDTGLAPLSRYEYRVKAYRAGGPAEGYISTSTATTGLDFPYAVGYGRGIVPSNYSQLQKNADANSMYGYWRATYMTTAGAGSNGMRVYKPEENGETVSEGMGYGMLISVYIANAGNTGKADFDKLLTYYKSKEKFNGTVGEGLMAWRIGSDGTVLDPWIAPDGDLDAAYALLVADKKWGSGGAVNYKAEAVKILNGLQAYVVYNRGTNPSNLIGGSDKPDLASPENAATMTMSSYAMVGYMKQFKAVSDAARAAKWDDTLRASYKMFDYFYDKNPATALTPYTFLTQVGPNQYLKPTKGYNFGPDACRVPWRVGIDYLWHGNANAAFVNQSIPGVSATLAHDMPVKQAAWLNVRLGGSSTTTGDPQQVMYSYEIDGTVTPGTFRWGQRNMIGSMAVGAMTDASNQAWLNRMYDWLRVQTPGQDYVNGGVTIKPGYFGDTVMMVTMLAVTGNMPNLPEVPVPAS